MVVFFNLAECLCSELRSLLQMFCFPTDSVTAAGKLRWPALVLTASRPRTTSGRPNLVNHEFASRSNTIMEQCVDNEKSLLIIVRERTLELVH